MKVKAHCNAHSDKPSVNNDSGDAPKPPSRGGKPPGSGGKGKDQKKPAQQELAGEERKELQRLRAAEKQRNAEGGGAGDGPPKTEADKHLASLQSQVEALGKALAAGAAVADQHDKAKADLA